MRLETPALTENPLTRKSDEGRRRRDRFGALPAAARAMAAPRVLTDDEIATIRQLYLDGVPITQIAARFNIARSTATYWIDGGPKRGPRHLAPLPRKTVTRLSRKKVRAARTALVERLWQTADRQVRGIEDRLAAREREGGQAGEPAERERDARMLAVLVKTLRELTTIDEAGSESSNTHAARAAQKPDPDDDDPMPQDIDEFRYALARRIQAFVENESGGALPGDDQ